MCLGKDNATSPNNRLSRSPSPNRFGLASGSQPILELLDGCPTNRRSQLSLEDSLTAVAQALIQAISGGGVQCNVNRVRREESVAITTNMPRLEGECILNQTSSTGKVCPQIRDSDLNFRSENSGVSVLQLQDDGYSEYHLGDMAREGLEFAGGGRKFVPDL